MDWNGTFSVSQLQCSTPETTNSEKQNGFNAETRCSTDRGYNARSNRIISIISIHQLIKSIIIVIQVYAPTTEAEANEIENLYESIQEEIDHILKQNMLIIIGDWNSKVGNKAEPNVGKFGLEVRNEAGDWLVDFCEAINLSIKTHASNN